MHESARKLFRTLQVRFPHLQNAKYAVKRTYSRTRRTPSEPDFCAILLFPDRAGKLFLDIGANRGQSIEAILLTTPGCRIEAFEPNTHLAEQLKRLYRHDPRVSVNAVGLGATQQECRLYVPCYKKWLFDGLASFHRSEAEVALAERLFCYNQRLATIRELPCRIQRLDDLNLEPYFVKLDVEGFEHQVIQGAQRTLETRQPVLLVEAPDNETIRYLARLGYHHYAFQAGKFLRDVTGKPNTFFMTESKVELVRKHVCTGQ